MFFSVCFGLVRANLEFTVRIDTKLNVCSRIFTLMEMEIGKCFDFYIHSELIFDKFDWIL